MSLQILPHVQAGNALTARDHPAESLEQIAESLDSLHTAISDGASAARLMGMETPAIKTMLHEITFIVREMLAEVEKQERDEAKHYPPTLTLLPKRSRSIARAASGTDRTSFHEK
jgi:hypothetical protein